MSNKFASIPCDAVVFCKGAYTLKILKSMLGLSVPLMPHKGYQFQLKAQPNVQGSNKILNFKGHNITAAPSATSPAWIITAFSDVYGIDKNIDQRRFRVAIQKLGILFDKGESFQPTTGAQIFKNR